MGRFRTHSNLFLLESTQFRLSRSLEEIKSHRKCALGYSFYSFLPNWSNRLIYLKTWQLKTPKKTMQIAQNISSISSECDKKSSEFHQKLENIESSLKNYQKIQNVQELPPWGEWRACTRSPGIFCR